MCHIGCKQLREDGRIVLIDNYVNKTKANVLENPQVAVLLRGGKESYQLKGTCEYVDKGEAYDAAYQWFRSMTDKHPAKGALIIAVTEVYDSAAGDCAGDKIQ